MSALYNSKPCCVGCKAANRTHTDAGFKAAASALGYGSGKGAHGRICTRTRPSLKRLSLLLDYMGIENGSLGWIRTTNPPLQRRMLSLLSYEAVF